MPTPYYTHGFAYSIQYAETAHKQRLLETHMMPRLCPEMKSSLTICSVATSEQGCLLSGCVKSWNPRELGSHSGLRSL